MTINLPLSSKVRINDVCETFEAQWHANASLGIEQLLDRVDEFERPALFQELLKIELELRRRVEAPCIREYLQRFPALADAVVAAFHSAGPDSTELGLSTDAAPFEVASPSTLRKDDRLNQFSIVGLIGRGSFGEVYLARDTVTDELRALKLLHRSLAENDTTRSRFLKEGRTAVEISPHPGLVSTLSVQEHTEGTPFIVMEYIEGRTLRELIQSQELSPESAAKLIVRIAEAVGYLHKQGFYHRDLKPSNILVDSDGNPRIIDFGLAIHASGQRELAGEFAGTTCYMAPEQIEGKVHLLDGRSNVWALGILLYETLTGQRPFGGDSKQVKEEILKREPRPPREIDDTIPPEYEAVCLRAIKKPISERFATVGDFATQLKNPELWWAEPEQNRLPGIMEWASYSLPRHRRTLLAWQRRRLRVATKKYVWWVLASVGLAIAALLSVLTIWYAQDLQQQRAVDLVNQLLTSDFKRLPDVVSRIDRATEDVRPRLVSELGKTPASDSDAILRLQLGLLGDDPDLVPPVYGSLIELAADRQHVLARLLLSDAQIQHKRQAMQFLSRELDRINDTNLATVFLQSAHEPELTAMVESADGLVTDRFVLVQSLPVESFAALSDRLDQLRYRPSRIRAYKLGDAVRLAALWNRSPHPTATSIAITKQQLEWELERKQADGYRLVDTSLYPSDAVKGDLLCAVWRQEAEEFVDRATFKELDGLDLEFHRQKCAELAVLGYQPVSISVVTSLGQPIATSVWQHDLPTGDDDRAARRFASAAAALWKLGRPAAGRQLLRHNDVPLVRTHLIKQLSTFDVSIESILAAATEPQTEDSIRSALLLALGDYDDARMSPIDREHVTAEVKSIYRNEADPELHSACEWLLRELGCEDWLAKADTDLAGAIRMAPEGRGWEASTVGHTFAILPRDRLFPFGSPERSQDHQRNEPLRLGKIPYALAVATTETTVGQIRQWKKDIGKDNQEQNERMPACVDWQTAIAYCNWLSQQYGLPADQWCYRPLDSDPSLLVPVEDHTQRAGFRLPKEVEWEYACRAGTRTRWFHGENTDLLRDYAWFYENSGRRPHLVGSLKPNQFGLFDTSGNVSEWCVDEAEGEGLDQVHARRIIRGGDSPVADLHCRSAARLAQWPTTASFGFRVVRTMMDDRQGPRDK